MKNIFLDKIDAQERIKETKQWIGIERRTVFRRQLADQRSLLRFEPDKEPQRSGSDRRYAQNSWRTSSTV